MKRISLILTTMALFVSCGRSLKAAKLQAAKGMVVYNLAGGITEWQKNGGATTKD